MTSMNPEEISRTVVPDPLVYSINRLDAHSDHRCYASEEERKTGNSSLVTMLNGAWAYWHSKRPGDVPKGLELPDADLRTWDTIDVPSHIQLRGYDRPQYVNTQYPWDGHENIAPGEIPTRFNPVSTYARDCVFPLIDEGEYLSFVADGAESALALWVDGVFIGYGEDSFTPSEFDVSAYADGKKHRLCVRVWKWSSGSWLEDQDFFRFSGLFRSVYFVRRPRCHVDNLRIDTVLESDHSSALVTLSYSAPPTARLHARLEGVGEFHEACDAAKSVPPAFQIRISNPKLWSPESPHLYTLIIQAHEDDGAIGEVIEYQIGVRSVWIDEDAILRINGYRAVLKGVNRHDFGPKGRVEDPELLKADLYALKRLGVNAIRTSHYPNPTFFYELCDRLGFYVIDEANVEAHGMWDKLVRGRGGNEHALPGDNETWLPAVRARADAMIQRDRNHPCIIMWSLGNESYGGSVLRDVANYVRSVDSRPVHYEGIFNDDRYPDTSDVISHMYTSAADVSALLEKRHDKPFIMCEYAHSMGNSFGNVDEYMALFDRFERFQGAFVWDFADQALARPIEGRRCGDAQGANFYGYGGDFGDSPNDLEFCGNGLFFADHSPSPKVQALKALYQCVTCLFKGEGRPITVRNRFEVIPLETLECIAQLSRNGTLLSQRTLKCEAQPGETVEIDWPFDAVSGEGEYACDLRWRSMVDTEWAEAGYEYARAQYVWRHGESSGYIRSHARTFGSAQERCYESQKEGSYADGDTQCAPLSQMSQTRELAGASSSVEAIEIVDGTHNLGVRVGELELMFSRLRGGLASLRIGQPGKERELLRGLPRVNFWHAPTSNERGWNGPMNDAQWLLASRYGRTLGGFEPFSYEQRDDKVLVTWAEELGGSGGLICNYRVRIEPDSSFVFSAYVEASQKITDPPECGFAIPIDPAFTQVRWYGEGPEESAADRRAGAYLGVYESDIFSMFTPYLRPQECGSRTGVRWACVCDEDGVGLEIASTEPMEFSALPHSPFEIENARHPHELPPHTRTWLRPASKRRGVGGDNSWGAPVLTQYHVGEGPWECEVMLRVVHI